MTQVHNRLNFGCFDMQLTRDFVLALNLPRQFQQLMKFMMHIHNHRLIIIQPTPVLLF